MVAINNPIDNTIGASNAGVTNTLTIQNPDNTNTASNARSLITVGGASAGDPSQTFTITGTQSYTIGADNSASDAFKISNSATLGTTDSVVITPAGAMTKPLQPAFLAYLSSQRSNVTGDGTTYQVICDTVVYDQASNYNNTTGVFTAPVTGIYAFNFYCRTSGITGAQNDILVSIDVPSGSFRGLEVNGINVRSPPATPGNAIQSSISATAKLNAGDTAVVHVAVFSGAKVCSVEGLGAYYTSFGGTLLC